MKKKIVRKIYSEMCERFQRLVKLYMLGYVTFAELLKCAGNEVLEAYQGIEEAEAAGTITAEESELIRERFKAFAKKELKNAFKA